MRFPRPGYREKIWDHAAGVLIATEAGAVVTDAGGAPLDFSRGRWLDLDRGIVTAPPGLHGKLVAALREGA
jgi:3'(2'), 5'-bisphosphate nucleotidase/inositol polyphosphate 1-phosphatase